jgi:hypothetical protein
MSKAEKFIQDYTRNCSNAIYDPYDTGDAITIYAPWLTPDQARKAVEIEKEEIIEKVCYFLDGYSFIPTYVINNLKQAIKNE